MIYSRRVFGMLALCLIVATIYSPRIALAQADAKATASLAKSREQYEQTMESIRRNVRTQIDAMREQAKKLKDNTEAVNKALQATKDFDTSGIIPDCKTRDKIVQDYAKAAAAMRKAYNDAKLAQGGEQAFSAEAEQFEANWDLVPWQDKLSKDSKPEVGATPLVVETGVKGEYRLEVKAKRTGDTGTLSVEFPRANGKRLAVPALIGDKGDIRVLLTVGEGAVIADLGATRPIDMKSVASGEDKSITLRGKDGTFAVESLRVKAIVEGKPPEVQVQASRPDKKDDPARAGPENPFQAGRKWSGTWDGNGCDIEVVEGGDSPAIRISRANGAVFRLEGKVTNGVFSLGTVKHVKVATGGVARFFTAQSGTAAVRNGKLYVDCTTANTVGSLHNQRFDITINGADPK